MKRELIYFLFQQKFDYEGKIAMLSSEIER